jgi:hypothetical protein
MPDGRMIGLFLRLAIALLQSNAGAGHLKLSLWLVISARRVSRQGSIIGAVHPRNRDSRQGYSMARNHGRSVGVFVVIDSNGQLGTVSSSVRFKEDIQDMGNASTDLMQLRPVTFRYKNPFADGSKAIQYGLIAEEVAEVYPDLVAHSADGQIETVKYQVLDSMLLNELQKERLQVQQQAETIKGLEARLAVLEGLAIAANT